jgi:manganese/zinc/iron transport system substrate-binding protein
MKKIKMIFISFVSIVALALVGCGGPASQGEEGKLRVVATTTHLTELSEIVGGEHVSVYGIMGPGVDPHDYSPTASDVDRMEGADVIIYHGLDLEGKMNRVFENMRRRNVKTYAVAEVISDADLLEGEDEEEAFDPHVWFDVTLWIEVVHSVRDAFIEVNPENRDDFTQNAENYVLLLENLHEDIQEMIQMVPEEQRVLVTAHDAFHYFGQAYGFEVKGLQGISTATEVGVSDIQELAQFIVEREIKAIFVESSVPPRNIEALKNAVISRGFDVVIGGELYSDALGDKGTVTGRYIGMFLNNVQTIVNALK